MKIILITKHDKGTTGLSRYVESLYQGLSQMEDVELSIITPSPVPIPRPLVRLAQRGGVDPVAFFASYPLRCRLNRADVYHLTSQTLATLLCFQRIRPVVVTVHDIIPFLVRHDPELNTFQHPVDYLFYWLALIGLRRANAIIAISEFTKRSLIEALRIPAERIHVVYSAVEHDRFRPMSVPDAFRAKYGLSKEWCYVLYVGSDDPRKNLRTLVRAFHLVKRQVGNVKLLKVGAPHFLRERQQLLILIEELGLQEDVLFFDHVPDEDLPLFYNVADVFVLPSLYEGFGLPVLEAMACGTPVVVTNSASLPEVIGDAGCVARPSDVQELACQLQKVLREPEHRSCLRRAGEERARTFDLGRQAQVTFSVYTEVSSVR
jgi:glycosyltransferase involved in cell wall biosynthesis